MGASSYAFVASLPFAIFEMLDLRDCLVSLTFDPVLLVVSFLVGVFGLTANEVCGR